MPEKNIQKSINDNLAVLEQESKGFSNKLSQERAYEILSLGIVLTMEEDIKNETKRQEVKVELIPNEKPFKNQEAIFSEKPIFDPFKNLEKPVIEKVDEKKEPVFSEFAQASKKAQEERVREILPEKAMEPAKAIQEVIVEKPIIEKKEDLIPSQAEEKISFNKENIEKIKQDLSQKIIDIEIQQKNIEPKEVSLAQRRKVVLEKIKLQQANLESLVVKTTEIKNQQVLVEKQEQEAKDSATKRIFEEQRWKVEESLKKAQDIQWAQEEEIEKAQMALAKIDSDLKATADQKTKLAKEKSQHTAFLEDLGFVKQKEDFFDKNKNFLEQKNQLEKKYNEAVEQKNQVDKDIFLIVQDEALIEEQERNLEEKIKQATQAQERRTLEQERREITQKRQIQEKKRWDAEKNQEIINNNLTLSKEQFEKIKKEEELFSQKIAEIEAKIKQGGSLLWAKDYLSQSLIKNNEPIVEAKVAPKPYISQEEKEEEKEIVERIRLQAKAKEQELIQEQIVQKQVSTEKQATEDEFKEIQEKEDREKAINTLKQIAQQEQQKSISQKLTGPIIKEEILKQLAKNSSQEEAARKDFLSRINKKTKPIPKQKPKNFEENVIFHPMIRKSSLFEKIAVRFLVVVIILGAVGGIYFGVMAVINKISEKPTPAGNNFSTPTNLPDDWPDTLPNASTTPPVVATSTNNNEQPATTTIEPLMPPISLIPVVANNIFSYTGDINSMSGSVLAILGGSIEYNLFEQILVFDEIRQVYLSPQEFFEILGATMPQELSQNQGTSTIVVFSSKFGNRLGFIMQTSNTQEVANQFLAQESMAEKDTEPIFLLMGKTGPAIKRNFSALVYKRIPIRCQTFTKSDLGICYFVYKDYFVWASSFEQASRIVDKLE